MEKQCPNCNSRNTIQLGNVERNNQQAIVFVCRECYKVFYAEVVTTVDKEAIYNPKFKQLYLEKKIPEIAEHKNFKEQGKISKSDKVDLKIDFWLMEHRKKNETTRTDNK